MNVGYLEILGSVLVLMIGGAISFMVHLANRLKRVEEEKVSRQVFDEVRQDIKTILSELMQLKLENAKWEAREEIQKELKHEKY